jgi:hypothetical protein
MSQLASAVHRTGPFADDPEQSLGVPVSKGEIIAVILGALLATFLMTHPLTLQMSTHLDELADSRFSTYTHTWVAHVLTTHPSQLWNMNFFFPAKGTLACSENRLGDQWLFAPVYLLTGNPVTAPKP